MPDWIPPFAAAGLLGVKKSTVHVIAHRRKWKRRGAGANVEYWTDDVLDEAARRKATAT